MQSHRGSSQALPVHAHGDQPGSGEPASDPAASLDQTANGAAEAPANTEGQPQQPAGSAAIEQETRDAAEQQGSHSTADQARPQAPPNLIKDSARQFADEPAGDGRTAHLASLAEQADIRYSCNCSQ